MPMTVTTGGNTTSMTSTAPKHRRNPSQGPEATGKGSTSSRREASQSRSDRARRSPDEETLSRRARSNVLSPRPWALPRSNTSSMRSQQAPHILRPDRRVVLNPTSVIHRNIAGISIQTQCPTHCRRGCHLGLRAQLVRRTRNIPRARVA
jgi:hypothetical protein